MCKNDLISIIIPVYNVIRIKRKFLQAIHSLTIQSYQNLEIIIVNDGSTDKTNTLLSTLKQRDSRIRIFNKTNGGVESARRYGLKEVHGEFILHLDQDDLYEKNAIELLHKTACSTHADVVIANSNRFIFNKRFKLGSSTPHSMNVAKTINHSTFMKDYYISFFGINDLPVNIWNKLYRKSFLDRIPEPPITGQVIEDLSYNMHILPYAQSISIIPDVLYYYRWGGYTNRFDKTILDTALIGYELKTKLIQTYALENFKIPTAIELLNYLNSHFYNQILHYKRKEEDFINEVKSILNMPQVTEAIEIVKDYNQYHNPHVDSILNRDYIQLYNTENTYIKNNRIREFLKRILLNL